MEKSVRPFGIRDKIGYLMGDFGNDFTFILSSSFLMKFYTDVMGVSAGAVGVIMMLARFVDAFTDVTMGRIVDRGRVTRHGKFRVWLLRMCVPVAVASFLMYPSALSGLPAAWKTAYLFVTYILWGSVCYTFVNIPYGSMASAISADPDDRQSLSTYRSMGGAFAGVVVGALVPVLTYRHSGGNTVMDGGRFTVIAGVFSVFAVICYLLCYVLTTERVVPDAGASAQKQPSVFAMLRSAVTNRALIAIIAASIVMLLSQLTMQSMANYVYPNYYGSPAAQSSSTFLMLGGMLTAAAVAKPLARRFGKAELSAAACIFAAAVNAALFFIRPDNVWVYVGVQSLSWLGLGVFSMVSWALITDVIDYSELRNGVREDGSIYALYSFARKLGQAASAGLTGALLTYVGYSTDTAFEPAVTAGLYDISVLVPALGFALLALVLWFWYPLHKKQVDANVAALKAKHRR